MVNSCWREAWVCGKLRHHQAARPPTGRGASMQRMQASRHARRKHAPCVPSTPCMTTSSPLGAMPTRPQQPSDTMRKSAELAGEPPAPPRPPRRRPDGWRGSSNGPFSFFPLHFPPSDCSTRRVLKRNATRNMLVSSFTQSTGEFNDVRNPRNRSHRLSGSSRRRPGNHDRDRMRRLPLPTPACARPFPYSSRHRRHRDRLPAAEVILTFASDITSVPRISRTYSIG